MVIIIVVILFVAGIGVYYFAFTGRTATVTQTSSRTSSQTISSTSSAHNTGSSSTKSSSTGSSGISTYSGVFNFSQPLGPGGERVLSNNTVQSYSSTQVASGSFTFTINAKNYSGSGSGHGTLTVTTRGFCSGKVSFPYTFLIPDATTILGGNITVFFGNPNPGNATVPLTCTGPMAGVNTAINNPVPFLSVFPNEISVASVPITVNQHLTGNISYYFVITQTS